MRIEALKTACYIPSVDSSVSELVRALHSTPHKAVVYVTGGASQALGWLLCTPGASNTVLEMSVPYARDSLVDILGQEPAQYCCEQTAVDMAKAAYRRAAAITSFGEPIVGVAATCALATEPPKRGHHRVHICAHTGDRTHLLSAVLAKGARSRVQEDAVGSRLLLKVLAEASGVSAQSLDLQLVKDPQLPDVVEEVVRQEEDPLVALLAGRVRCVEFSGGHVYVDAPRRGRVVLPGSFNPLHKGHRKLLEIAVRAAGPGLEGCFELSVGNADKGVLLLDEVRQRVEQFTAEGLPLVLTGSPLFTQKGRLMPNTKFVVGWDTAVRLLMPKYHGGTMRSLLLEYQELRSAGCSFLVAGRKDDRTGRFWTLADMQVPAELEDLFSGLTEAAFRVDISSTQMRTQQRQQQRQEGAQQQQQQQQVLHSTPATPPPSCNGSVPVSRQISVEDA